jgi:hypothetical protein
MVPFRDLSGSRLHAGRRGELRIDECFGIELVGGPNSLPAEADLSRGDRTLGSDFRR